MGCFKLTYCNQEEAQEVNGNTQKKCIKGYRYGFNGQERDNEWKGDGNSNTTYWRQYDPRLGRWMSLEPKPVAWESEYAAFRNNPIYYADPNGDWVKGAGFVNNVFKSDQRNKAEMEAAKHSDGVASKVDGTWRVTWTEGTSLQIGKQEFNMKELHMVEYKYGGVSVEDAIYDGMRSSKLDEMEKNYPVDGPQNFDNGMKLLLGTWSVVLAPIAAAEIGTAGAIEQGLFYVSSAFMADDATTIFYGKNRTFLSETLGITPTSLDRVKFVTGAASYGYALRASIAQAMTNPDLTQAEYEMALLLYEQTKVLLDTADQLKK